MARGLVFGAIAGIAAVVALTLTFGGPVEQAEANSAGPNDYIIHTLAPEDATGLKCLALNVYWEARSEPLDGQFAVAAVTLNRTKDERFPSDLCAVVRDGGESKLHRCQFSWWCDGKQDAPVEEDAWRRAEMVALLMRAGVVSDPTDGALWYHADYVTPDWLRGKVATARIGRHVFYAEPFAVSSR